MLSRLWTSVFPFSAVTLLTIVCAPLYTTTAVARTNLDAQSILQRSIDDVGLSKGAKAALHARFPNNPTVRVIDILPLSSKELRGKVRVINKIKTFLSRHHLRFGMTEAEINFYRVHGFASWPGPDTGIDYLNLSTYLSNVLAKMGIRTLAQGQQLTRQQMQATELLGESSRSILYPAFRKAGFPFSDDVANPKASGLQRYGFSARTSNRLSAQGITELYQIVQLTRLTIEETLDLSQAQIAETEEVLAQNGFKLYDDDLARAEAGVFPIDYADRFYKHVRLSKPLRAKLAALQIYSPDDLIQSNTQSYQLSDSLKSELASLLIKINYLRSRCQTVVGGQP